MTSNSPRILVTGAGGSAASNFLDALRLKYKENLFVVGADVSKYHLELADVNERVLLPPVGDPGYVGEINKIVDRFEIEFIHAQPDVEVGFIAANRELFRAPVFLPDAKDVEICHDKMIFNERLRDAGVLVPEAFHIKTPDSLKEALDNLLPHHSKVWLRAIRGAGSRGSLPINSFYQGDAWIDYWRNFRGIDYGDFMVSEFLPGHEFAWQSLWYNGELITSQARERVEYIFGNLTPSGQSSSPSVARTVNREDVNEIGEMAVRAVTSKPHGVYCVDMKESQSGLPKVTEINVGRFFTTSNFFAHAGLNMPAMYLEFGLTGATELSPAKYNPLDDDLYWVRMVDMGFKLVRDGQWTSRSLD